MKLDSESIFETIFRELLESTYVIAHNTDYEILTEAMTTVLLIFSVFFVISVFITLVAVTLLQLFTLSSYLKNRLKEYRKEKRIYGYYNKGGTITHFKIIAEDIYLCDLDAQEYADRHNIDFYFEEYHVK